MNEGQVSFLIKAASLLSETQNDSSQQTKTMLKSYYLMRCRDLSKEHGLPAKYFSSKVRCSRCLIEWNRDTESKVRKLKLTKKQRQRIRRHKITNKNKDYVQSKHDLLNSYGILEQICAFCKNSTDTPMPKPTKPKVVEIPKDTNTKTIKEQPQNKTKKLDVKNQNVPARKVEVDVYSKTKDIFSLSNKNNNIQGVLKEQKVIKHNKRKKDKFAGLCQQAVLASAKLKEEKLTSAKLKQEEGKQNKLNLFLKPSSS